jgi:hypothetical protein
MVESKPLKLDILSGDFMASCAIAQGERTLLPAGGLEMAEVAGTIRYLNVCAHHNLAVAACAAKLLSSAQVPQVKFVVEADPFFEGDLARQDVRGMASRAQAAGVFDLGVGFGTILFGHVLNHGIDGLELDPHGRLGLGGIMTLHAGHFIVLGGFPGLVVGLHDMATVAKRGARAIEE